jgi:hypothetical protein
MSTFGVSYPPSEAKTPDDFIQGFLSEFLQQLDTDRAYLFVSFEVVWIGRVCKPRLSEGL